ncbi:MAG: sugar transferase [Caldimonas sp.]
MDSLAPLARPKRVFDVAVTLLMAPLWVPVCLIAALALRITAGTPVTYRSRRRVVGSRTQTVTKFRTMVRNAEQVLNRETVPITDTCFLNIPPEHPVYTPVGRALERYALTELPQLLHVLAGKMSLVGNRPLPENVVRALRQRYPYAEDRFLAPGGLTGPVQLIGRDEVSDEDRLAIEIDYCLLAIFSYRWRVDALILWNTVMVALKLKPGYDVAQVRSMLAACLRGRRTGIGPGADRRQTSLRFAVPRRQSLVINGDEFVINDFGYRGLRLTGDRPLQLKGPARFSVVDGPVGELRARVCWTRKLPDGPFEIGLALAPGDASALHIGQYMQHAPDSPMRHRRPVLARLLRRA